VKNDTRPCLVLTTWPADQPIETLVQGILAARLAACVHVAEAGRSTYRWQGAIEVALERQVVIKTTCDRVSALEALVLGAHPYALPEWLVVEVTGSDAYLAWIAQSVAEG
jgi:periplasmic divalent cation tolerance protein